MKLKGRRQSTNVEYDINFNEPGRRKVNFLDHEAGLKAIQDAQKEEMATAAGGGRKTLSKNQKENITKTHLNKLQNAGITPTPTPRNSIQVTPGRWKTKTWSDFTKGKGK